MGGVRASVGAKKVGPFELCILKICRPFCKSHTLPLNRLKLNHQYEEKVL